MELLELWLSDELLGVASADPTRNVGGKPVFDRVIELAASPLPTLSAGGSL